MKNIYIPQFTSFYGALLLKQSNILFYNYLEKRIYFNLKYRYIGTFYEL